MPARHRRAPAPYPAILIAVVAGLIAAAPARASDVDTEHLFGFTEGADIGKKASASSRARPSPAAARRPANMAR
jgi:hypothetical protein